MTVDTHNLPSPPAEIVPLNDAESGLSGVIVLHSTRLGPAAGGCRFWPYASDRDATVDALRLARRRGSLPACPPSPACRAAIPRHGLR